MDEARPVTPTDMPKAFDPQAVEAGWYARWEADRLFVADANSDLPKFAMCFPPPNITGELHMGHALQTAVYDLIARYKRMTGYEVLFLPGYDHAAIATQNVIEKQLAREGTTKEELGREAFDARVNAWYESVGATIINQLRLLGASMDWTRLRFTMDSRYYRSVMTAFVAFYEKGWVYRAPRIVNWCPHDRSAISDLEVEWQEHQDTLYFIKYPIQGGGEVTIATVRPETMLADTGVAVNPTDERYKSLVGKTAILPLVGRELPIVADEAVEKEFGTGALKVTPGHDPLDYEIGQRHGLPIVNGMNLDGSMHVPGLPYDGLPGLEARKRIVKELKRQGLLVREEPYVHEVGHCDRCHHIIEPLISEQWWLRMEEMRDEALAASSAGKVQWHPERYERTYLDWLRGLRDWNIGRQLWLGHRVPVYGCENGHQTVSVDPPDACAVCGSTQLTQDTDVLDTWFSSALWPFATLGWPDDTDDLEAFYPTDINCTAREIINLWVSRMIMTGLEFMDEVPFRDVAIHCVVQAADGRRMSKSLGTGVNPLDLIEQFGADGTRYGLLKMSSTQDVRFSEGMLDEGAKLANKLWNAARFVLLQTDPEAEPAPLAATAEDRWILSRLAGTIDEVVGQLDAYDFAAAVKGLYGFIWNDFCDWYVEAAKARLYGQDEAAQRQVSATLVWVLERTVALAHPVMPFVTEEIWGFLPGERAMLLVSPVPEPQPDHRDPALEESARNDMEVVSEARRLAGEGERPLVTAAPGSLFMALLERAKGVAVEHDAAAAAVVVVACGDRKALEAKLKAAVAEHERARSKLANEGFLARAPAQLVDAEREKAERFAGEVSDIQRRLEAL